MAKAETTLFTQKEIVSLKLSLDQIERAEAFITAYTKHWGNVTRAAKISGYSTKRYYHAKNTSTHYLYKKIEDADKMMVDKAREYLGKNIESKKEASIFFFLKKKAREEFGDHISYSDESSKYDEVRKKVFWNTVGRN